MRYWKWVAEYTHSSCYAIPDFEPETEFTNIAGATIENPVEIGVETIAWRKSSTTNRTYTVSWRTEDGTTGTANKISVNAIARAQLCLIDIDGITNIAIKRYDAEDNYVDAVLYSTGVSSSEKIIITKAGTDNNTSNTTTKFNTKALITSDKPYYEEEKGEMLFLADAADYVNTGLNGDAVDSVYKIYSKPTDGDELYTGVFAKRITNTSSSVIGVKFSYFNSSGVETVYTTKSFSSYSFVYVELYFYGSGTNIYLKAKYYDKDWQLLGSTNLSNPTLKWDVDKIKIHGLYGTYYSFYNYKEAQIETIQAESRANTNRQVISTAEDKAKTKRQILKDVVVRANTSRDIKIRILEKKAIPSSRKIIKQYTNGIDTKRHIIQCVIAIANTKREIAFREAVKHNLKTRREIIKACSSSIKTKRYTTVDVILVTKTKRIVFSELQNVVIANTKREILSKSVLNASTNRLIIADVNSLPINTKRQINGKITQKIATKRDITKDISYIGKTNRNIISSIVVKANTCRDIQAIQTESRAKTKRLVLNMFTTKTIAPAVRIAKDYYKNTDIELLECITVKNDKGQSNIQYKKISNLDGRCYVIKNNVESTPVGLSDKTKFLLITKNRKITTENFVRYNNIIYAIDILAKYTAHVEVYLKEL